MAGNSHLGKGLSSIFGTNVTQMLDDIQKGQAQTEKQEQMRIPVAAIRPNPYQPRKVFEPEALEDLAQSIRQHGVFTPILVKKSIQGYDLIAGERRLRASKLAGVEDIPAIVVDFDDQQMMEISLLENIQREDLNVIEEAKAYDKLIKSFHYTQEQAASRVGKSREHITNLLRLLRLPEDVQQYVVSKQLSMGHVRALLSLKDEDTMRSLARQAIAQGWSVRKMEQMVREASEKKEKPAHSADPMDNVFVKEACRQMEDFFQSSVKIKTNSIQIYYENEQDLTRILEKLDLIEKE
ncbi:MAG: ParB/RepB/Spo0J family partition protein [Erysipelotrichaceae bacterium]|nr:ParB/RepB/Spo0J family partition protein [Erysipelotrichaceae bacterium]